MRPKSDSSGRAVWIIVLGVFTLFILSFVDFSKHTDGVIKNYDLFGDILIDTAVDTLDSYDPLADTGDIDPELLKAMDEAENEAVDKTEPENVLTDNENQVKTSDDNDNGNESGASYVTVSESESEPEPELPPVKPNRNGETVLIENYSQSGLAPLRNALRPGNLARIAVIGDSYIEGDIFTQNLRELMQTHYGGAGVGYMNMHSEFPGFRRSVRQSGSGWVERSAAKRHKNQYMSLSEQYFLATSHSTSNYKGVSALKHIDEWNRSMFLFVAPMGATIKAKTSDAEAWETFEFVGSNDVQALLVEGRTSEFNLSTSTDSLVALGVWLDSETGVSVDCMSSRGYSGITLSNISVELCRQMSKYVDYDLIVLEFGINAMSAKQRNYSVYSSRMVKSIERIRECYPNAAILLMGIGDRGEKRGSTVHSMSTAPLMIEAQRDAARKAGVMFWDTREAMGGEDAIVDWSRNGYANKDYIHLTHKGGGVLAERFFQSLQIALGL